MGYYPEQVKELEDTINQTECDVVLVATPFDLGRLLKVKKPLARISYGHQDQSNPSLTGIVSSFLDGTQKA